MTTIGIIMEVNPFHNGHKFFLEQIRSKYPKEMIICVVSSTVVQRGEISVINKDTKTKLLLDNGVDLVVELPLIYSNQGGEYFAYHCIKMLNDLKVDKIIFGSESNDIDLLKKFSQKDRESLNNFKNGYLKEGLENIKSNDILGISYLKAIAKINSNIEAELVRRISNNYNDINLSDTIASATSLRRAFQRNENIESYLPKTSIKGMRIISNEKIFDMFKHAFIILDTKDIFLSENGQLINKMNKVLKNNYNLTYEDFIEKVYDKNNSKYKIQRIILNVLLNISTNKVNKLIENNKKYKILGFNMKYSKVIKSFEILFDSYKDIDEFSEIYVFNEKIDIILNINNLNYKKPIIKR